MSAGETEPSAPPATGQVAGPLASGPIIDFFISRRGATAAIAQEVADVLIASHHSVLVQDYDIGSGANFVEMMHDALKKCRHFIALLTKDYDVSPFTKAEWTNFYAAAAASGGQRRLILLRVEDCNPQGLLAAHVYSDLVGISDPAERKGIILAAVEGRISPSAARSKIFEHVPARDLNFTGRDAALAQLHVLLTEAHPSAPMLQVAIHTLGGTGKTALAAEYVYRRAGAYSGVWWARAEGRTLLIASLAEMAGHLDPNLVGEPDLEKAARAGLARLARSMVPFLLVYDNVDQPETLRELVPTAGARVLITTRWADWMGRAIEMKLEALDVDAAVEFLQRRSGRKNPGGAEKLARALGFLPLALDHAGAYCRLTGSTFEGYLQKIDTRIVRAPAGATYPASVAATFGLAIEQVAAAHPQAETLLACFAFLAPELIPLDLMADAVSDEDARAEAMGALAGVSLVEIDQGGDRPAVAVHRLVQAAMRARLAERQATADYAERDAGLLVSAFPDAAFGDPEVWPQCAELLPHVLALYEHYRSAKQAIPDTAATLFGCAAGYLHGRGAYDQSEPLFRTAIETKERIHGRADLRTVILLGNLALLLQETGRFREAETLCREVIATKTTVLGPDHLEIASSLTNLADLLRMTGRSSEAEPLLREAIRIKEVTLGRADPSLAISLNNLANALLSMGRSAEAEPLYREVIAIEDKAHGRAHPHAAIVRHNLAVVLRDAGRHAEAEPLLREAVTIWSAALGLDHPQLARGQRNLAVLLLAISRAEEALPLAKAAFDIHEQKLPGDHVWRIDSVRTYADALAALGRADDAAALRARYDATPRS